MAEAPSLNPDRSESKSQWKTIELDGMFNDSVSGHK